MFWDDCGLWTDDRSQIWAQRHVQWDSISSTKMLLPNEALSPPPSCPVCAANSCLCPPWVRAERASFHICLRVPKEEAISWSFAMDHACGSHLTQNMEAPEEDKTRGAGWWGGGSISLGFPHWHEMSASLPSASSNPWCWHYTSCTVDPPPCCRLPSWIISCVTAVVAEVLARQTWKHHFNA